MESWEAGEERDNLMNSMAESAQEPGMALVLSAAAPVVVHLRGSSSTHEWERMSVPDEPEQNWGPEGSSVLLRLDRPAADAVHSKERQGHGQMHVVAVGPMLGDDGP